MVESAAWQGRIERAVSRLFGGRSVAVFEYPLHPAARYGWGKPPHPGLLAALDHSYEPAVEMLLAIAGELGAVPRPGLEWENDYWGGLDAAALYAFIASRRPALYVEVGSGFSTMFARRAMERHGLKTRVVTIDPAPRADIDALSDVVIRQPLEHAPLAVFDQLAPGDMVVIDGSHTAFMGGDAVVAFLDVLPRIPPGVLVAIDDVFLPWDYPPSWVGRWYGEQYLLATMLLAGAPGWEVVFPAWYVTNESSERDRLDPVWRHVEGSAGRVAKSFWMERVAVDQT